VEHRRAIEGNPSARQLSATTVVCSGRSMSGKGQSLFCTALDVFRTAPHACLRSTFGRPSSASGRVRSIGKRHKHVEMPSRATHPRHMMRRAELPRVCDDCNLCTAECQLLSLAVLSIPNMNEYAARLMSLRVDHRRLSRTPARDVTATGECSAVHYE